MDDRIQDSQTYVFIEKYKEISANRRHYSSLRFALLPVFFAIQGGITKLAFIENKDQISNLPLLFYAFAGILITYVFWTIEERILVYYKHFEDMGAKLEGKLGYEIFNQWPASKFKSNTKLSIRIVYTIFFAAWLFAGIYFFIR